MRFLYVGLLCLPIFVASSCSKSSKSNPLTADSKRGTSKNYNHVYKVLSNRFLEQPDTITLRHLLTKALPLYGYEINEKNLVKFGADLTVMRKASHEQISEDEILERMLEQKRNRVSGRLD